ncbi:MAG: monovalent cation/H(+) antiporter subunit G [Acidobacteria bacterium]|nr:monovalent cation/H(+) antiporter subunit G [Acidobacteriota bacterium]
MVDWIAAAFWLAGATFALLASVGVVRMPDLFTRMQAASKASTLGLACLLIGTAIELGDSASVARAVSIAAFVMLTTPVSAHVVARAAARTDVPLWSGTVLDERREDQERGMPVAEGRRAEAAPGESSAAESP